MTRRYTALRIVGTVYKILGVITIILTIVVIIAIIVGAAVTGGRFGRGLMPGRFYGVRTMVGALGAFIYGSILAVTLYAFGEGIYLLIALEENTRRASEALQREWPPQAK
jgi:uncharacterized membrane protein